MAIQISIRTTANGDKTYSYTIGHDASTTFTFRQHKAQSHCQFLHTYPMRITATFDKQVYSPILAPLTWLNGKNVLVLAKSDPQYQMLYDLFDVQPTAVVDESGCEMLAKHLFDRFEALLKLTPPIENPKLLSVEVSEKPGNYASYDGEYFYSGKKYGPDAGFTTTFIDLDKETGKPYLHGGLLTFDFKFKAKELDHTNFVVDFGSLKTLKGTLENFFDHTLWANQNETCQTAVGHALHNKNVAQVQWGGYELDGTTHLEYLRRDIPAVVDMWIKDNGYAPRVEVASVIIDMAFRSK